MNIYESFANMSGSEKFRTTIVPQKHVIVERINDGIVVSAKRFDIGDIAEYDSHNLSYTGPIKKITSKNIIVETWPGSPTRRMIPAHFAWRNWNFSVSAAEAKNAAWSD